MGFSNLLGKECDFYGIEKQTFKLNNQIFEFSGNIDKINYRYSIYVVESPLVASNMFSRTLIAIVIPKRIDTINYQLSDHEGHLWLSFGISRIKTYSKPSFQTYFNYYPNKLKSFISQNQSTKLDLFDELFESRDQ